MEKLYFQFYSPTAKFSSTFSLGLEVDIQVIIVKLQHE